MKNPKLRAEWENLVKSGCTPVLEYQIGENDFLVVDVEMAPEFDFILFSFDKGDGCKVFFDGDIDAVSEFTYSIELDDEYSLYTYIQRIASNIEDGYLAPNDLQYGL